MKESYYVEIEKEEFTFSAAHFITFNGNICERLHGHNYGVRCRIESPLDENRYVYDFIAIRDSLKAICQELDHHMLLPDSHPAIHVIQKGSEIEVTFEERRWVFPEGDCRILPLANTTVELLARYVGLELLDRLQAGKHAAPEAFEIGVDENNGQWGVWRQTP
ncbi:MAG: 6-pyruvoyl tetrahydropterin synthase family protein [Planctomycetota bacterium]|nr:6-pyruvoyl tetrahydropterin synthase family protein [Planctomycetota bacterium]